MNNPNTFRLLLWAACLVALAHFTSACGGAAESSAESAEIELLSYEVPPGMTVDFRHAGSARASFFDDGRMRGLDQLPAGCVSFDRRGLPGIVVTLYGPEQAVTVDAHDGPTRCE